MEIIATVEVGVQHGSCQLCSNSCSDQDGRKSSIRQVPFSKFHPHALKSPKEQNFLGLQDCKEQAVQCAAITNESTDAGVVNVLEGGVMHSLFEHAPNCKEMKIEDIMQAVENKTPAHSE